MSDAIPARGNLKAVNQYARRHAFFSLVAGHFTTSERRSFERDVYDYARALGLTAEEAKGRVAKARDLCRDEGDEGEDSALENEVDDSESIPQALQAVSQSTGAEAGREKSDGTTVLRPRQPSTPHSSRFFDPEYAYEKSASSPPKRRLSNEAHVAKGQKKSKMQRTDAKTSKLAPRTQTERTFQTESAENTTAKVTYERLSGSENQPQHTTKAAAAQVHKEGSKKTKIPRKSALNRDMGIRSKLTTDIGGEHEITGKEVKKKVGSSDLEDIETEEPEAVSSQYKQISANSSETHQDHAESFLDGPGTSHQITPNAQGADETTPMTRKEKIARNRVEKARRLKYLDDLLQGRRDARNSPEPANLLQEQNERYLEPKLDSTNVEATGDVLQTQQETMEADQPRKRKKKKKKTEVEDAKEQEEMQDKKHKKDKHSEPLPNRTNYTSDMIQQKNQKKRCKSPRIKAEEISPNASELDMFVDGDGVTLDGAKDDLTKCNCGGIPWGGQDVEPPADFRTPMILAN
ncbi:hypothetical protein MMC10_009940 [Thelotrema lepadinum]|nr:hypothetical protein [Thelotrema lepadinum]